MANKSLSTSYAKVTVRVTNEDIALGERRDCSMCPVARAIERRLDAYMVAVDDDGSAEVDWMFSRHHGRYLFSETVARRIRQFDETGEMRPFTFVLRELA